MTFGRPLRADALLAGCDGDRRMAMDAVGLAIAQLLPPSIAGSIPTTTISPPHGRWSPGLKTRAHWQAPFHEAGPKTRGHLSHRSGP